MNKLTVLSQKRNLEAFEDIRTKIRSIDSIEIAGREVQLFCSYRSILHIYAM